MQTEGSNFEHLEEDDSNVEEEQEEVQYGKPDEILYFTNRFELGHESCYQKLNKISKVLGSVSGEEFYKADAMY